MVARAREKGRLDAEYAGRLSELLAPHLPAAVQAWVDGLQANKAIWSKELKDFVETNVRTTRFGPNARFILFITP
jgi:hypothetical protein